MQDVFLKDFGGISSPSGTNIFDNTNAFANAISILRRDGGGTLTVTKGVWYTGPIELFSDITLKIEEDAEISFLTDENRYLPVYTRWEGVDCYAMHPCIFANGQKNVRITGKGTINGNGRVWWEKRIANKMQKEPKTALQFKFAGLNPDYKNQPSGGGGRNIQFLRPPLIQFYKSTDCVIEDVRVCNSPFWTVHPVYCKNVVISGIRVENPAENASPAAWG